MDLWKGHTVTLVHWRKKLHPFLAFSFHIRSYGGWWARMQLNSSSYIWTYVCMPILNSNQTASQKMRVGISRFRVSNTVLGVILWDVFFVKWNPHSSQLIVLCFLQSAIWTAFVLHFFDRIPIPTSTYGRSYFSYQINTYLKSSSALQWFNTNHGG